MEIITRTIKYTWQNRLSIDDKVTIASLYLQGYAIFNIAESFTVTPSTIQYHLQVMGVYSKNKRPTLWNRIIIRDTKQYYKHQLLGATKPKQLSPQILTIQQQAIKEAFKDAAYENTKPSTYLAIIKKQQEIRKTFKPNYLVPLPITYSPDTFIVTKSFTL